jgi:three-Cys-motif partner protein
VKRRSWGFWTEHKLDILGDYLSAFTKASSRKARGVTVYLDLFAGTADDESRATGAPILGSARRALETSPPLRRLYFFDLPRTASALRRRLEELYPGRSFTVQAGDSNDTVDEVLRELRRDGLHWAPTFAFLDPYNLGIKWTTIQHLAEFKQQRPFKIELWVVCFSSTMPRILTSKAEADPGGTEAMIEFFGTDQWKLIRDARVRGTIDGTQAQEEYVNLYRWRLEHVLGYRHTQSFNVRNRRGTLYHLVFATDNDAGFRIMGDLYKHAARVHDEMRAEALEQDRQKRDERRGVRALFSPDVLAVTKRSSARYRHEPPWTPLGTADDE